MTIPTWEECAALGMSAREAAEARGLSISGARSAARRLGLTFRDERKDKAHAERAAERMRNLNADPEFARANAERMRNLHADPEFAKANAERMRALNADPEFNPLAALSDTERADYDVLKRAGYTRNDAFRSIGRQDLVKP